VTSLKTSVTWKTAGLLGLMAGLVWAAPSGAGPETRRMDKQIGLFEMALDEMLVESPNFLVQSRDNTRGTYFEGMGAVFTFKTSLNTWPRHSDDDRHWIWSDDDDDVHIVIIGDTGYDVKDGKEWKERLMRKQETLYERGKKEIVETIADFGDLLSTLDDEDWLKIEARLRGAALFKENDVRRLTVQVKMRDVRAYVRGTLDEDELGRRIQIDES
jgi:hypothetical protein